MTNDSEERAPFGKGFREDDDSRVGKKVGEGTVSYFRLFKYADWKDVVMMVFGTLGAIGDGLTLPASIYLLSGVVATTVTYGSSISTDFSKEINQRVLRLVYLSLAAWVACFLGGACWMRTGERQSSRLRSMYLRAILRQNEGLFDEAGVNTAELVNSVSADTLVVQEAMSEKVGSFIMYVSFFLGGLAVSFYLEWRIAVVFLGLSPLLIIPGAICGRTLTSLAAKRQAASSEAGTIAEQAISSIRTVYSFGGEKRTVERYSESLDLPLKLGLRMGLVKGLAVGSVGISFAMWGLTAWYGGKLVINHAATGAEIVYTGFASLTGGLALGNALPSLRYFAEARVAATRIFAMINRVPEIDPDDMSGKVLKKVVGSIELRGIDFAYPSRPDSQIFKNLNLDISAGVTMALVGRSGSGKSTILSLIERFYDPLSGQVLVDGINIKDLQLKWLRTQIGLVSQEPALFATSIMDNILFGMEGASTEDAIQAAKSANAHSFISLLPGTYDTQVGEQGVQMSGGQKQRIAIARAILKNPPILLLDEATSALDAESEKVVQEALEAASIGRTTVVVAHRLSTICTADIIAVVSGGQIVELGSHENLLKIDGGAYAGLVSLQNQGAGWTEVIDDGRSSLNRNSQNESSILQTSSFRSSPRRVSDSTHKTSFSELGTENFSTEETHTGSPSFCRLLALNKLEWKQGFWGSIGAICFGLVHSVYSLVLATMISTFYVTDHKRLRREVDNFALIFLALAVFSFLVNALQHYNFAVVGERLTKRIRVSMLSKILTFEVGWFDQDDNSSGAICSRLSSEANVVRSLVGDRISLLIQTSSAITAAMCIGLVIAWKFSIVAIALQPVAIFCFYTKRVLLCSMYKLTRAAEAKGSQVAVEAVIHHRTISAFSGQNRIMTMFDAMMASPREEAKKRAIITGLGLGMAQFATHATMAFMLWWGGRLMQSAELSYAELFKCFIVLMATGKMIAEAGSMTSDLSKGAHSIISVFGILDRNSKIDSDESTGVEVDNVEGHVELTDVDFAYPARPNVLIFKKFNLVVPAGAHLALIGKSGSGKSTIIGLIERFYDPKRGTVRIDGADIKTLQLRSLRGHIALVGQEPTLFAGTIRENILYGRNNATEAEIVEAARSANALEFISSLKGGFDTQIGERGVQLSGGQKQRIAIARAILKNPAILLLDEATSALDAQSEKVVQDALDKIMVGRTTIVIAHRLSTIQNCDSIAVIQDGAIVEQGKHHNLIANGTAGVYRSLVKLQTKNDESE